MYDRGRRLVRGRRFASAASAAIAGWLLGLSPPGAAQTLPCEATQYGLSATQPDNTAALQSALSACAGRTLHVAAGTYRFAPALAFPESNGFGIGISVPGGTAIV